MELIPNGVQRSWTCTIELFPILADDSLFLISILLLLQIRFVTDIAIVIESLSNRIESQS